MVGIDNLTLFLKNNYNSQNYSLKGVTQYYTIYCICKCFLHEGVEHFVYEMLAFTIID